MPPAWFFPRVQFQLIRQSSTTSFRTCVDLFVCSRIIFTVPYGIVRKSTKHKALKTINSLTRVRTKFFFSRLFIRWRNEFRRSHRTDLREDLSAILYLMLGPHSVKTGENVPFYRRPIERALFIRTRGQRCRFSGYIENVEKRLENGNISIRVATQSVRMPFFFSFFSAYLETKSH